MTSPLVNRCDIQVIHTSIFLFLFADDCAAKLACPKKCMSTIQSRSTASASKVRRLPLVQLGSCTAISPVIDAKQKEVLFAEEMKKGCWGSDPTLREQLCPLRCPHMVWCIWSGADCLGSHPLPVLLQLREFVLGWKAYSKLEESIQLLLLRVK